MGIGGLAFLAAGRVPGAGLLLAVRMGPQRIHLVPFVI